MSFKDILARLVLGRKGIAYLLIGTLCYIAMVDISIREKFVTMVGLVVSFYFGSKASEKKNNTSEKA